MIKIQARQAQVSLLMAGRPPWGRGTEFQNLSNSSPLSRWLIRRSSWLRLRKHARGRCANNDSEGICSMAWSCRNHQSSPNLQVIPMSSVPNQICWREHNARGTLLLPGVPKHSSHLYPWFMDVHGLARDSPGTFSVMVRCGVTRLRCGRAIGSQARQVFLIPSHSSARLTSRTRQLQGRTTKPILRDFLQNADFEKGTSRWLTSDQVPIHAVLKTTILTCIMLYIEGLQAHKTAKLYHSAEHSSMVLWNYILILLYLSFYTLHCLV